MFCFGPETECFGPETECALLEEAGAAVIHPSDRGLIKLADFL
jgi:hypothetical protein